MTEKDGSAVRRWSTMAHARDHGSKIRQSFNAAHDDKRAEFKAKRLGSQIVQRGRPHPVLKPSPKLAHGPDREAHHNALANEHIEAQRQQHLAKLHAAKDKLYGARDALKRTGNAVDKAIENSDPQSAKDAFKAARKTLSRSARTIDQSAQTTRDADVFTREKISR